MPVAPGIGLPEASADGHGDRVVAEGEAGGVEVAQVDGASAW